MSIPTSVSKGDQVTVQFEGRLPDGTVFEASTEDKPLSFAAGGEDVLKGVSDAVIGMSVGETREVEVPPELGFGERHDALVRKVERSQLPEKVEVGDQLTAKADDRELNVWVSEVGPEHAVLDANHPLAGTTVTFIITVTDNQPA